jgi:hypothetical protein
MKRLILLASALLPLVALGARADHVPEHDGLGDTGIPLGEAVLQHGDIEWVTNVQAGHGVAGPLGEGGTFTRDGKRYLVASDSIYGLSVLDVTEPRAPRVVSTYASHAGCPTADGQFLAEHANQLPDEDVIIDAALGATAWENDLSITPDGRIAILGADAPGRCHDPEYGGLELVDISDVRKPRTLALTRDVGYAHSVTVDPFHPWLAYVSTSDGNDFIDVVDFRSCLGGVAATQACAPNVGRIDLDPSSLSGLPTGDEEDIVDTGCHDIRFLPGRLYCAAVSTTVILDTSRISGVSNALSCNRSAAERADGPRVADCSAWSNARFRDEGSSLDARLVAVIPHGGPDTEKPPTEDVQISHQAEPVDDGRILLVTDERGGGLNADVPTTCPAGGIHFYDIRNERAPKLMKQPDGSKAIFITEHFPNSPASCTVHYGQQFGEENILIFAWYTAGTHVIRFTPDYSTTPATVEFEEIAAYIPTGAWTIQAKGLLRDPAEPDTVLIYTADMARGVDVLALSLPTALAGPASGEDDAEVLGRRTARTLPRTGVDDPLVASTLLAVAAAVLRMRRRGR